MTDQQQPEAPAAAPPKSFMQFLLEQRGGLAHSELTDQLAEVAAAVMEHDKAGTLRLEITISPTKMDGCVQVTDKVTSKVPEAERGASLFFADSTGHLSRSDPRQPELPGLRTVGKDTRSA